MSDPVPPRQQVTCPHCGHPLPGLLAQCWKPTCLRADIAADAAFDQAADQ